MKPRRYPITRKKLNRRKKIIDGYFEMMDMKKPPMNDKDYNELWELMRRAEQELNSMDPAALERLAVVVRQDPTILEDAIRSVE